MKILITGAAGFIGSYLARALIKRGDYVIGIDNFSDYYAREAKEFNLSLVRLRECANYDDYNGEETVLRVFEKLDEFDTMEMSQIGEPGKFKFYEGDIRDQKLVKEIFSKEKPDKIMHLAAMAGVPYSLKKPRLYADVNIDGTVNLLQNAVEHKIKNFVFASSSSVYGSSQDVPFKETHNVDNPISPYAATKRMGEIMCYTYSYLHELPTTCLRFFTVYGPLQRPYGMAIQKFIKLAYNDQPLTIFGDGSMGRDCTYIDDILRGIIFTLDKPQKYEIFNLGNSSPIEVNEFADAIIKTLGRGEKVHIEQPKTEVPITYADTSKMNAIFGYKTRINIEEGVKKQIEVFKMMPDWYKKLKE